MQTGQPGNLDQIIGQNHSKWNDASQTSITPERTATMTKTITFFAAMETRKGRAAESPD
ncbi:hypothetical protein Pla175_41630 [Pirellulimonas nuda]|uniref:Uncharacterized protein n=1 Tax=Pirellulimonas nuda TaxID=2528009 RepID=A0A518DH32_9BACT|nr:hypothetical protein Pla175_41630 [Pirellulimonas nuda]